MAEAFTTTQGDVKLTDARGTGRLAAGCRRLAHTLQEPKPGSPQVG